MKLDYILKKPGEHPGEISIKEKYTLPVIPGKEIIILDKHGMPYDLSALKKITIGFKVDENTEKNTGAK